MILTELAKIFASKNLFLIQTEDLPERRDDLVFIGTLDGYLEAIKVLGGRAIFVSAIQIAEEDFAYIPHQTRRATNWPFPSPSDGADLEEEIYEYDLCSVIPELESLKSRIW